jgi:hypothetical protein
MAERKVLEYLNKKGYSKTEATLRRESAAHGIDGKPLITRAEDAGGQKYFTAFSMASFRLCYYVLSADVFLSVASKLRQR